MDSKEKNSFKDLENKRNNFDNSRSLCTKSREEVELQGCRLRRFMESVDDNFHIYGKDVSEYHYNEYNSIQKIDRNLYGLEDRLTDSIQREKNEINQLEEEIKKNESKQQYQDKQN